MRIGGLIVARYEDIAELSWRVMCAYCNHTHREFFQFNRGEAVVWAMERAHEPCPECYPEAV